MSTLVAPYLAVDEGPALQVLHPGDVACAGRGQRLETLLGSCVAVLLTDPRGTVGGMCHIVHAAGLQRDDTRFGDAALHRLYALLLARSIVPRLCRAWVIGGGNMFPGRYERAHVGDSNVRWVLQALQHDEVAVIGQDLGGSTYRRVGWTVGAIAPEVTAMPVDTVRS
jgi:chemotaxis protein CheD